MRLLRAVQERLGFTRNELLVVFLLTATLLTGSILRALRPSPAFPVAQPDYTEADSQFAAGARAFHESLKPPAPPSASPTRHTVVDLNSATATDLEAVPGIGPALARRIIAYRTTHGRFRSVDELIRVKGIGERTLARLRPHVRVAGRER